MDLEPEGKVFVVISLMGSFTDGKIPSLNSNPLFLAYCNYLLIFLCKF